MTEQEWLACHNPCKLLSHLLDRRVGGYKDQRKYRLIACAAARIQNRIKGREGWENNFINMIEDWAEIGIKPKVEEILSTSYTYMNRLVRASATSAASQVIANCWLSASQYTEKDDASIAANYLRDIIGNPFKPLIFTVDCEDCGEVKIPKGHGFSTCPKCKNPVQWNFITKDVIDLANGAYHGQRNENYELDSVRLSILADCLEDNGYSFPLVIDHLRDNSKPHIKGCYVIDMILGK